MSTTETYKIKTFAMTRKSGTDDKKLKIVMLDEFDGMLPLSQQALRNIMESFSTNCRFLLSSDSPITPIARYRRIVCLLSAVNS